jgi:RNA polymerase sigma factor (sigma-70 family)
MSKGQTQAVLKPLRFLLESGSMAGLTDGQLLERFAASRDSAGEAAFANLVSRHGPMVLATCRQLLGDLHSADDAFQAVFLVLARRTGAIRRPELLGPWLHGVATKIARKARAQASRLKRREKSEFEMTHMESSGHEADARMIRDEDFRAMHEEIGRLSERYRRAVVLCHFEGLTHAEAARRLGCAPGTVGSLISRAHDLLRTRLARRGLSAGAVAFALSLEPKMAAAAVPAALEHATIQAALSFATAQASIATVISRPAFELANGALKVMTLKKLATAGTLLIALGAVVAAGVLAAGMPGSRELRPLRPRAQEQARIKPKRIASPALPGAVAKSPPWIETNAPFDVAGFFAAPPPEENAAPRYLEALFEFGPEVDVCFPDGPDRQSRKNAVEQRLGRFWPVYRSWSRDPGSVPAATIDAVIAEFDTGFRKLDWAQQRPRCMFESGVGVMTRLPHVQAVGHVARVAELKFRRELDRGEFDAALRDLARVLRLSRDLLPRGAMIAGMVSASADRNAVERMLVPMLTANGLTVEHCDRILALLIEHDAGSIDAYAEGLRAGYLSNRATLHDLVFEQDRLRKELEGLGNVVERSIVWHVVEPVLYSGLAAGAGIPAPASGKQSESPFKNAPSLDARIARTTPAELATQVEKLNELYRGLLGAVRASGLERIRKSSERPRSLDDQDLHTLVVRSLSDSAFSSFTQALAKAKARMRIAQGLVTVRRWQLVHNGQVPPSLEAAAKEAGLAAVPVDPFDAHPIRFAVVGGQPTVYSIGQDGRDDGGKVDNARTPEQGDVLLRLPAR